VNNSTAWDNNNNNNMNKFVQDTKNEWHAEKVFTFTEANFILPYEQVFREFSLSGMPNEHVFTLTEAISNPCRQHDFVSR